MSSRGPLFSRELWVFEPASETFGQILQISGGCLERPWELHVDANQYRRAWEIYDFAAMQPSNPAKPFPRKKSGRYCRFPNTYSSQGKATTLIPSDTNKSWAITVSSIDFDLSYTSYDPKIIIELSKSTLVVASNVNHLSASISVTTVHGWSTSADQAQSKLLGWQLDEEQVIVA